MAPLAVAGNRQQAGPIGSDLPAYRLADSLRLRQYREYLDWYQGKHWSPASGGRRGRTALVVNYARAIVDKGVSYLLGRGLSFAVAPETMDSAERGRARQAEALLQQVYWDNDLDQVDLSAALNGGILGDSLFKLFWDPTRRLIRAINVDPFCFFARWPGDDLSTLSQVELVYRVSAEATGNSSGFRRNDEATGAAAPLTPVASGLATIVERWTANELTVLVDGQPTRHTPNPYGFIPFVHIPNLPRPNEFWGVSDLVDVIPLNRELNARLSDRADLIAYHADPPTVFRGISQHSDLPVGPGSVWDIPLDAEVSKLELKSDFSYVKDHIENLQRALYEVSETPRTAFGDSGRLLSGVALETELRPLVQRTLRKRVYWTAGLRRRNALILRLAEQVGLAPAGGFAPYRSRVVWPPVLPRDELVEAQANATLVAAGLRSHRSAMASLGVEDPDEELARVAADRARLETS